MPAHPEPTNAALMQSLLSQLLTESRVPLTNLAPPYDPKDSINNWLNQYELSCDRLSLSDNQKLLHITTYLPPQIAHWVSRSPRTQSWTSLKDALLKTYGIPVLKHKQVVRHRLESLRQGNVPSRQFAVMFEDVLLDFPTGHSLDADTLRSIYLKVMNPSMRKLILPNVPQLASWTAINSSAIAIEESVALDEAILDREFANLSLDSPPIAASDPSPMEIDAFHRQSSTRHGSSSSSRVAGATRSQPRGNDPMRRWTEDGKPICSHCKRIGHLTKKCRSRNQRSHLNAIDETNFIQDQATTSAVSQPTVNTVQISEGTTGAPVTYAAVPIEDDPLLAEMNISSINSSTAVSTDDKAASTPRIKITLQGYMSPALVDTGANISAIRTSLAVKLGLTPDTTKAATFTIANNTDASSLGVVTVPTMIGSINTVMHYHVVDTLSHPVIIGYPQLKRLGAIIDTTTNEVRFNKSVSPSMALSGVSGFSGRSGLSGSPRVVPSVCTMVSTLRLPSHHHAYTDIQGPPNSAAFVSTPPEIAVEKCFSIAAGVVNFNKDGIATVKIANLDKNSKILNKGQKVATYQYLSPSLQIHSISESNTQSKVPLSTIDFSPYIGQHLSSSDQTAMQSLLQEFPDCFNSQPASVTPLVKHSIDTGDARPLSQPPHRASAAENETIDSLIDDMLKQGIIRPSNSPWSSPVVIVRKHDGSPRFCVDYRRLNAATTKDVYPLPRIDDTVHSLGKATVFSTLDLTSSYWQIELDEDAKPKSAFICRSGLYEFVRMPFGLTNAPATMQRLMDSVLAGLKWQVCLVYLDDIVCFSPSFEQHLSDLRSVLSRLRSANLTANLKKCKFACDRISFLGYVISPDGLHTDPEKIRAVSDFPKPVDVPSLRSFLGLAGYYRCFISKFSVMAAPLNELLQDDATWHWSSAQEQAFLDLKSALTSAPVLRFPDFSRPFELHTDGACTAGIGVILCQRDPRNNRAYAVAFASRSLSPAERNYGVSEVEALAIVYGIKKFAPYLASTKFTVVTDHHSLQFLNNSKSTDLRGRLARWTLLLQQHDFDIVYRPGSKNAGPDALSRYPVPPRSSSQALMVSSMQASDLLSAQASDPFCRSILNQQPLPTGFSNESGILFYGPRPVLPSSMRQEVFDLLHSSPTSGHLGVGRTLQRFSRLFHAPGLHNWVKQMVNTCDTCQRVKGSNATLGHTNLKHSDTPVHPFDSIAIDTFGPLPISRAGNKYIIVIQDLFSRYVILNAVPENTDKHVIDSLSKVFATHGIVRTILSDNGKPYSGILLKSLSAHLGIKQKFAPAYHPQANGLVERFMATLRNMIVAFMDLKYHQVTWDEHLNEFQLAYNSSIHDSTKFSPFFAVFGREPRLLAQPDLGVKSIPLGEYQQQTQQYLARAHGVIQLENIRTQAQNAIRYNKNRKTPSFSLGDLVLVDFPVLSNAAQGRSAKLVRSARGPFKIIKVLSSDRYDVLDPTANKTWPNVHAERLKPYNRNEDIAQNKPPECREIAAVEYSSSERPAMIGSDNHNLNTARNFF